MKAIAKFYWVISVFIVTLCYASNSHSLTPVERWLESNNSITKDKNPKYQWKFAHPAPPVSHLPPVWLKGFDWLKNVTQERMNIKTYGAASLYSLGGGFKALRAGVADYGTCYTVAQPKGFEQFKTFQLPYIAPANPYLTSRIINELMADGLNEEFNRRGVYPAHVMPVRPLTLMSKTPIRTPEDLRGKKIVSYMNAPGAAKDLGYSEVRIPFPEIYTALQQGVVDGVIWVDMGFIPFKIYELAKYYTALNVAPATIETCMNRRSFDKLDKEMKQIVHDFQQKVAIAVVDMSESFARNAREILINNEVEIIELDRQQNNAWKAAFEPSVERWMQACEKAGKDCRSLAKKINSLVEKYQGLSDDELMSLAIDKPVQGIIKF